LLWAFENWPSISKKKKKIKFGWWICLGFKQQMLYPSGVTAVRVEEQCGPSSLPSPGSLCLWRFRWGRIKTLLAVSAHAATLSISQLGIKRTELNTQTRSGRDMTLGTSKRRHDAAKQSRAAAAVRQNRSDPTNIIRGI
jgi:hypothetical protein